MPSTAPHVRWTAWAGVLALVGTSTVAAMPPVSAEAAAFFENKVRPVLVQNCVKCHGPARHRGGLRLDSRAALVVGGDQGPAVVPGEPDQSLLVAAVRQSGELKMPPSGKLPARQIGDLVRWVRMGAPWPGRPTTAVTPAAGVTNAAQERPHWAFLPVRRPPVPPVTAGNPVDAFMRARLQARGLRLSGPATRRELIRRVYFDLVGLPPTPQEVDAFVTDNQPGAWEALIDRLLASPHYGERWGRHWLDVVRFGQTHGYERDDEKPNAWRYRDWVIRSFNDDEPYDRFVREQLAGDELEPVTDGSLTATGFFHLGAWDDEPDDARQSEFDNLDDMVSTTGEAFLGLTVGCARCHDHKFDLIPQEDYYGLLAFYRNIRPCRPGKDMDATIQSPLAGGGKTLAVRERGAKAPPTHVLVRGNAATPGRPVEPHFPAVLCAPGQAAAPRISPAAGGGSCGRRRALAEWVASADNPLTARVLVNRVWQHHFGRGLVATPNDFGRNGAPPTHAELLDWLAAEFMAGGWKLKRLHKLILLSDTYRQSSRVADQPAAGTDPGNTLWWRQDLRRLEAEVIRDALLAVSGRLNPAMGGRGFFPTLPQEVLSTQSMPGNGWGASDSREQDRRSVYIFVKRTLLVPLLETFDFANPDRPVAARTTTTVAPQALLLLNSRFMDEQSAAFADRLLRADGEAPQRNVERAFQLALGRPPERREHDLALGYLGRARAAADNYRQALAGLCKVVFNLNEFVYVD
jgi:hypothetical protein